MDVLDWIAIIGAAAWTPQIITWVQRALAKPKVSLHLHLLPQIGFTTLGPIFNVSFALLSEKKDAILNKISAVLRHESGASYTFVWEGLSEDLSEMENPMGQTVSIKKTVLPLVVRVLHTGVAQVFVRFRHEQFRKNVKKASVSSIDRFNYLKTTDKLKTEEDIEELVKEQPFVEFLNIFNSEFIWSAGKYSVTFDFQSPNNFTYTKREYIFELSQADIDELRKNIDYIKLDLMDAGKSEIIPNFERSVMPWVWRNPELQKKEYTKDKRVKKK